MENWFTYEYPKVNDEYIKGYEWLTFTFSGSEEMDKIFEWKKWLLLRIWYDGDGNPCINLTFLGEGMAVLEFFLRQEYENAYKQKKIKEAK